MEEANESSTATPSMRAVVGCVCGRGNRAKIDEPGYQRVTVAINVAGDDSGAIIGYPVRKHSGT
jgi:hypothetical protein